MSKELRAGVERFDGKEVSTYTGRFTGGFDIDVEKGAAMAADDQFVFIVTARVGDAKFSVGKASGILNRQNTFNVEDVEVFDKDMAKFLLDSIGREVAGVTDLVEPNTPPVNIIDTTAVDENQLTLDDIPVGGGTTLPPSGPVLTSPAVPVMFDTTQSPPKPHPLAVHMTGAV